MKNYILILISLAVFAFTACNNNNDKDMGNPAIELQNQASQAFYGDSLVFTAMLSDNVPLSTLKVDLYFGEEIVSSTTIRTKENGEYTGKIYIPFYANIPNGTATLEYTVTNTHLGKIVKEVDLPVSRPKFPYLILVSSDGTSYPMTQTNDEYGYSATASFPSSDLLAYIKTPAYGENGNEQTFGWNGSAIEQGLIGNIPFSSKLNGVYSVTFNTLSYAASPFLTVKINDTEMTRSGDNFVADLNLTQGQVLNISGIDDIQDWWIDQDWFTASGDNSKLTFKAIAGKYRITADFAKKWFRVEVMSGSSLATLQTDGTGAIWVIGMDFGKPSLAENEVGWNDTKAVCMVPIGNKKYQITLVGGETVNTTSVNFKFFYQKGWGGEFAGTDITSSSDLIYANYDPLNPTTDNGNLRLYEGKTLEAGATYVFVVDVSAGNTKATLLVTKK
jgi:hypothetical protein